MREEAVALDGKRGVLRGILHRADRAAAVTAFFLQGFFSSTHVGPARLYVQMARALARRGLDVLRMDPHGVGDSDGDFTEATYASELEDYRAMLASIAGPVVLMGHSLGASIALRLAADGAERARILRAWLVSPSCGPFSFPSSPLSSAERAELVSTGSVVRKGTVVSREFMTAIEDEGVYRVCAGVSCPCTIFYGTADEFYDRANVERLARALPSSRLVTVDDADHNYLKGRTRAAFLEHFEQEIAATSSGRGRAT